MITAAPVTPMARRAEVMDAEEYPMNSDPAQITDF